MNDLKTKKCSRCAETKLWSEYVMRSTDSKGESRPNAFCKVCGVKRVQDWKMRFPERYKALNHGTKELRLRRKIALMGGRTPHNCDICGTLFVGVHHDAGHYDHNHGTGEARGWLCTKCNAGLGSLGDNPKILERALDYLLARGYSPNRPLIR